MDDKDMHFMLTRIENLFESKQALIEAMEKIDLEIMNKINSLRNNFNPLARVSTDDR